MIKSILLCTLLFGAKLEASAAPENLDESVQSQENFSIYFHLKILQILLEDINKQENAQYAIRIYPVTMMAIQHQAAVIACKPMMDSKGKLIPITMSKLSKKKLSDTMALISKEYSTMKENAYYNSKEMKTLCQGTDDIVSIEWLIKEIQSLWLGLD